MLYILLSLVAVSGLSFSLNTVDLLLTATSVDVSYPKIVGEIIIVIMKGKKI